MGIFEPLIEPSGGSTEPRLPRDMPILLVLLTPILLVLLAAALLAVVQLVWGG